MGTGAEAWIIPAVISAVGTGASVYNTQQTAQKQDEEAAAGIRQQAVNQNDADAAVSQQIGALAKSTPEAERSKANADFLSQLRRSRATATGEGLAYGASRRYGEDEANAADAVDRFGAQQADLSSRVRAPMLQRENESVASGRLASTLGQIGRNVSGDAFLNQLRLGNIRRNAGLDAFAGIAQGTGSALAGRASRTTPGTEPLDQTGVDRVVYGARRLPSSNPRPGSYA